VSNGTCPTTGPTAVATTGTTMATTGTTMAGSTESATTKEEDEGLTSSEWAAVSIALVIASLILFVVVAGIFKWYYQRRHSRRYRFQNIPTSETHFKNQAYRGDF
jgi:hypothetical protein